MNKWQSCIIFLAATVSWGFTIVTEEAIAIREQLCEEVRKEFGEDELSNLIRNTVHAIQNVDGVDLQKSNIGDAWLTMDWNPFWHLISEDWAIRVDYEYTGYRRVAVRSSVRSRRVWSWTKKHSFEFSGTFLLLWLCDADYGIFIQGHKNDDEELIVDSVYKEEVYKISWR